MRAALALLMSCTMLAAATSDTSPLPAAWSISERAPTGTTMLATAGDLRLVVTLTASDADLITWFDEQNALRRKLMPHAHDHDFALTLNEGWLQQAYTAATSVDDSERLHLACARSSDAGHQLVVIAGPPASVHAQQALITETLRQLATHPTGAKP